MKKSFLWILVLILTISPVFTSCSKDDDEKTTVVKKEYFTYWNQCEALTALKS